MEWLILGAAIMTFILVLGFLMQKTMNELDKLDEEIKKLKEKEE